MKCSCRVFRSQNLNRPDGSAKSPQSDGPDSVVGGEVRAGWIDRPVHGIRSTASYSRDALYTRKNRCKNRGRITIIRLQSHACHSNFTGISLTELE